MILDHESFYFFFSASNTPLTFRGLVEKLGQPGILSWFCLDLHMTPRSEPSDLLPRWRVWTLDQRNRTVPRTNLKQLSVWVNKQNLFLATTEGCWIFFFLDAVILSLFSYPCPTVLISLYLEQLICELWTLRRELGCRQYSSYFFFLRTEWGF